VTCCFAQLLGRGGYFQELARKLQLGIARPQCVVRMRGVSICCVKDRRMLQNESMRPLQHAPGGGCNVSGVVVAV
jgi:hypothetical protein